MASILIIGRGGQVSRALAGKLGERALIAGREQADLATSDFVPKLDKFVGSRPISAVINAAAHTLVDKAEKEEKEMAVRVNTQAVAELADWCAEKEVPLVHYSTDYVFDGTGTKPHHEDDKTAPVNAYGASKLGGEKAIAARGDKHLIFRTSWVYDAQGKNFFNTILRLLGEKESLNIVSDQVSAPTYAYHLAAATLAILDKAQSMPAFPSGIYHLCSGGETSWYGFAQAIFALAKNRDSGQSSGITCQQVNPIPSSAYPLPARRPLNTRLDCTKARATFGVALPDWQAGLKECFEEKYAGSELPDRRLKNHPA